MAEKLQYGRFHILLTFHGNIVITFNHIIQLQEKRQQLALLSIVRQWYLPMMAELGILNFRYL